MNDDDEAKLAAARPAAGVGHALVRDDVRARLFGKSGPAIRVGRFELREPIGRGGAAEVYAAIDSTTGAEVAVKVIAAPSPAAIARMAREARALRELRHPHVVRVLDSGEYEGGIYLAMPRVAGETMRAWLARKPARERVWHVLRRIGEALAAVHDRGLVHRDVKPDNVVVDAAGDPTLLDFGLAGALEGSSAEGLTEWRDTLTRTGAALGTPGYMAPEQMSARAVDGRADQFAFCVTAWFALYGALPFRGRTADAIGVAALRGRIEPPPRDAGVSASVEAALRKGLSPDPSARHRDMPALLPYLQP